MSKRLAIVKSPSFSSKLPSLDIVLVNGFPLVYYPVLTCSRSARFDEIVVLSTGPEVDHMASILNVPAAHIENGPQDYEQLLAKYPSDKVVVFNSTAPLMTVNTCQAFCRQLDSTNTCLESPSDEGKDYAAVWGCNARDFVASQKTQNPGEPFILPKTESFVVHDKEDLFIVEAILSYLKRAENVGRHKFSKRIKLIDGDVVKIMKDDSVSRYVNETVNSRKTDLMKVMNKMGTGSWCYQLIANQIDQIGLICQQPNESVRPHAHVTKDEWWVVMRGEFEWRLDGGEVISAKEGELVYLPAGTIHEIVCVSKESGIRLACGAKDFEHIYYT